MGSGYIAFPVLRGAYKEFNIMIDFRPDTENGLMLFSSEHPNARADFFSITLIDGYAEFRYYLDVICAFTNSIFLYVS